MGRGLGDLIKELHKVVLSDPNVLKLKNEIPAESLDNYKKYLSIISEINKREEKYNSYKYPPRY